MSRVTALLEADTESRIQSCVGRPSAVGRSIADSCRLPSCGLPTVGHDPCRRRQATCRQTVARLSATICRLVPTMPTSSLPTLTRPKSLGPTLQDYFSPGAAASSKGKLEAAKIMKTAFDPHKACMVIARMCPQVCTAGVVKDEGCMPDIARSCMLLSRFWESVLVLKQTLQSACLMGYARV